MSDNIIRPDRWLQNGQTSLEAAPSDQPRGEERDRLGGGGDGPHDPDMEQRVSSLETDVKDVKASLGRIETTLAVISEGMKALATKTELTAVAGAVNALSVKTDALGGRVDKVERTVDSKVLGPWQFPLILAASGGVLGVVFTAFSWLMAHGLLPH